MRSFSASVSLQRGDEDRALDRKLEGTVLKQLGEHGGDAEPFPDPAEQMRLAATDNDPSASASSALMSNTWSVSLAPDESSEASAPDAMRSSARPEIGDDRLAHGAVNALVLDHLDVGAIAGLLDAEEHGASERRHHGFRVALSLQAYNMCKRGTTF